MELSILVFCLKKQIDAKKFEENLFSICQDCEIIYLTNETEKIETSQKCLSFNENNEDKILNSVLKTAQGKSLLIIRENFDLNNFEKIQNMLINGNKADIILYNKKYNKFTRYMKKIYNLINNKLLNFTLYNGDISLMLLGNNATAVLKEIENPSRFLKINNWSGLDVLYLENTDNNYYKPQLNLKIEIIKMSSSALVMILSIILGSLNIFQKFYFKLIFVLLFALSFVYLAIILWRLVAMFQVGKFEFGKLNYSIKENKGEENGEN